MAATATGDAHAPGRRDPVAAPSFRCSPREGLPGFHCCPLQLSREGPPGDDFCHPVLLMAVLLIDCLYRSMRLFDALLPLAAFARRVVMWMEHGLLLVSELLICFGLGEERALSWSEHWAGSWTL